MNSWVPSPASSEEEEEERKEKKEEDCRPRHGPWQQHWPFTSTWPSFPKILVTK